MNKIYKLEVYVPSTHLDQVKSALFDAGAGRIGDYDRCCWQTLGDGQFRPLESANPFIGDKYRDEIVQEYKVELVCDLDLIDSVISALTSSHPYETPAFQYWIACSQ